MHTHTNARTHYTSRFSPYENACALISVQHWDGAPTCRKSFIENHFETSAYACRKSSSYEPVRRKSFILLACDCVQKIIYQKPFFDVRVYMQKNLIVCACLAILLTLAPFYPPGDTKSSQKWLLFCCGGFIYKKGFPKKKFSRW